MRTLSRVCILRGALARLVLRVHGRLKCRMPRVQLAYRRRRQAVQRLRSPTHLQPARVVVEARLHVWVPPDLALLQDAAAV